MTIRRGRSVHSATWMAAIARSRTKSRPKTTRLNHRLLRVLRRGSAGRSWSVSMDIEQKDEAVLAIRSLFLGGRNISNCARAQAEEPEVFAQRLSVEGSGAGDQLAGVVPVCDKRNRRIPLLLGILH